MLLGTLRASLLRNLLTGRGVKTRSQGHAVNKSGKGPAWVISTAG